MATEKILFAITKGAQGGAQRYVYDLARSLPQDRYEPVVAIGGDGSWLQRVCTAASIRTVTLSEVRRDVSASKDTASFFALVKLFKKEKPDVVHLNSSKIGALGAIAARIAGVKKIIFTAHGWAYNEKRSVCVRAVFWLAHALTMLLVDQTIANSAATARAAPIKWKLTTIPLGIGEQKFLARGEARKALSLESDTIIYGSIAELHKNKGLDVLIDALPYMEVPATTVIIGGGEKRAALIAKITAKKLKDRVTLMGHKDDAAQYLTAFDIFVLPSRTESSGYVLLEAGLAGLPIVATNVGGIPEIIEDNVTGLLVPSENPRALSDAIQKLISDPALREKLGSSLKSKVIRDFSLEKMVQETMKIYTKN
jgi:glycosyltransferase involved in cell wall biosynthesis